MAVAQAAIAESTLKLIREGPWTFEDFVAWVPDGQKADLLDGAIYMGSPDNTDAAELNEWLLEVLGCYVRERDLGKVYVSRVAYKITEKSGPEPDIGFVAKAHVQRVKRRHVEGPPDLVIEIVSPDSVHRDYVHKRQVYEAGGAQEYWILDPDEGRATFLRLRDGKYEEVTPKQNRIHSEVVPGFWLDVRWLFDAQRPTPLTVLKKLLATEN